MITGTSTTGATTAAICAWICGTGEHPQAPDDEERERNPCPYRRIREEREEEDFGSFFFSSFDNRSIYFRSVTFGGFADQVAPTAITIAVVVVDIPNDR